jgi:two-component system, sensor histidine kinase
MTNISIIKWLRNISIARKLYFTVGIMALLIAIELMTLMFAIRTLSSVRTLVGAEGLWSKAQKDAIYNLQKYGASHDEKDYQSYLNSLKVNLGDRKTRLQLEGRNPDINIARQGFLEGRLHPDDINGAIKLISRFHGIYYIGRVIQEWDKGDTLILQLQATGNNLHTEINAPSPSPEKINVILNKLNPLNDSLTVLEDDFSYTLGAGSRWLADLISKLLFGLVLTVEISGLTITILVSRSITKGLNEIIRSAKRIAAGDFKSRAKAYSEDEIGILANSFNDMAGKLEQNINELKRSEEDLGKSKEQAEQAVVIKDHFVANMSHEIRTPMNAIIGFTDLLEQSTLDEEQKEFVNAIKVSGKNLTAIINDILDYSKIRSGMITLEKIPISIRSILGSIHVLLQQKAMEKNLAFNFNIDKDIPEEVIGDPTRLTQILSNLIDNALKFTEKGSVEVQAMIANNSEESVAIEFRVKDTGKGVPEDKQAIIFERFTQVSAETSRRYGGTGLGLSIVKSLVELQQGTISLKSELNKGSLFSFTITFPKGKPHAADGQLQKPQPGNENEQKIRILYAEDNALNQMLVMRFSKKFGFETETADNGQIAVEKLQQNHYDLVLMDIQMPEMDGYEATRVIRNELKSNIPIIALTAHAMSGEKEKCLGLGMNDFVSKPFDQKELNDKILAFFKV